MQKIPTVFVRDENDRRFVTDVVNPGCEWVLAGEGVATRKYDGTCVRLDEAGEWWARREVKPGKTPPANYVPVEIDETTGKTVGWEPIGQSSFAKFHAEAIASPLVEKPWEPGTYELCGPKVNGDPENYGYHCLVRHADAAWIPVADRSFDGLKREVLRLQALGNWEGLVFHNPDGRMAKLKARDFPKPREQS